ncbi:ABC transporter permease [Rhizobium puerariae]|uniref:ABC transporter permease n=1 Tax=Rhizobium puerariae TaxID=1585791 RepID=A0ABV6AIR0_9HYPH
MVSLPSASQTFSRAQAPRQDLARTGLRHPARSVFLQYGIAVLTLVLVAGPILPLIYQSVLDRPLYEGANAKLTLENYTDLFTAGPFKTVIVNTFIFAFLSTVISQFIGVLCAVLVGRTNVPGRRLFGDMLLWPLLISHLILSFGWFLIYGPAGYVTMWVQSIIGFQPWNLYTLWGMSLVAGISQAPLAALYCLGSITLSDPSLEDAARTCGAKPARTLWSITLPLLTPAILYGSVLNFTSSLEMLSIPLIFGEPGGISLFTTFLYSQGVSSPRPNYGLVATAAVLLLIIVALLVFLQGRLLRNTRKYVTVGGKASRKRLFDLGNLRWVAFAFLFCYTFFFIVLPLGILVLRAFTRFLTPLMPIWPLFTLDNFRGVLASEANMRAIANTVMIAVVGGAIATVFIAAVTLIIHRSEFRYRRPLEYIALFPRAIPGLIAGIGFFYMMVFIPPVGWLRNSVWILILAYTMRYIPTAFASLSPTLMQIGPDLDRSARVMGADWLTAVSAVILKLMRPALFSCFAILFIHFLKEYSIAIFLIAPGSEVIGTTLLQYWVLGDMGPLSALATIQIILTILFIAIAKKVLKVNIYD